MQPQATERAYSAKQVSDAIKRLANLTLDAAAIGYLGSVRSQLLTAIDSDDGEAVASYCARSIHILLADAGFQGRLTPDILRQITDKHGWNNIHDAIHQRENAITVITSWARHLGGASGSEHAQRAHPSATAQPAPINQQHPIDTRTTDRSSDRASGTSAGVRRHNSDNVRHIGAAREPRNEQQEGEDRRRYDQKKVHGGRAALTLEADTTRAGAPTIRVEAAKMLDKQARTYDWKNKIAIQLTTFELQVVAALFSGFLEHCKFSNHGPEQDKWFEVERQTGQYAGTIKVVIGKAKDMCIVQVTPLDMGDVHAMLLRQAASQLRLVEGDRQMGALAPTVLRGVAQSYKEQVAAKSGGAQRAAHG